MIHIRHIRVRESLKTHDEASGLAGTYAQGILESQFRRGRRNSIAIQNLELPMMDVERKGHHRIIDYFPDFCSPMLTLSLIVSMSMGLPLIRNSPPIPSIIPVRLPRPLRMFIIPIPMGMDIVKRRVRFASDSFRRRMLASAEGIAAGFSKAA